VHGGAVMFTIKESPGVFRRVMANSPTSSSRDHTFAIGFSIG
jgi:hypothetical protein